MISFQDHPKAIFLSFGSNISSVRFQINMKEVIVSMQSIILILTFELFLTSNATETSCESRNVSNCNEETNVAVESNLNNSFRPLSLWFQMISKPSFECKEQEPVKIEGVIIFSMRFLRLSYYESILISKRYRFTHILFVSSDKCGSIPNFWSKKMQRWQNVAMGLQHSGNIYIVNH